MVGIIVLVVVSNTLINKETIYKDNQKLIGHSIIIIIVFIATGFTCLTVISSKPKTGIFKHNDSTESDSNFSYNVVIPYQDRTLVSYLGSNKFKNMVLAYEVNEIASNEKDARKKALTQFSVDQLKNLITPYFKKPNIKNNGQFFRIDTNQINVQINDRKLLIITKEEYRFLKDSLVALKKYYDSQLEKAQD